MPRFVGSSYHNALVPGGARGVLSKLNIPSMYECADSFGFTLHMRDRLRVSSACGSNLSHNCIGDDGCTVHSPAMK